MEKKVKLSFVIPCYRSEDTIKKVIDEITQVVSEKSKYSYEIICINDCSPDNVVDVLKNIISVNSHVKLIDLAKNMGKDCAIMAGFSFVSGDYIINMDDDFQCPVSELWKLLEPLEAGLCDVTTACYAIKRESIFKRIGSDFNMWMTEVMLGKPKGIRFENFTIMKRFVLDEILKYKNPYPSLEGLVLRVTNHILPVDVNQRERADENGSGFGLIKSLSMFINGVTSFSVKPLRVASFLGMLFAILGFIYGIYTVARKIFDPTITMGYSSILAVILFSSGLIMMMLGIIGEYVGRIFICINNSPQYVIRNVIENNESEE